MFVVEQDERGGHQGADAPGTATVAAEGLEGGLEQDHGVLQARTGP